MRVYIDFFRAEVMATLKTVREYAITMDQQLGLLRETKEALIRTECIDWDELQSQKYEFDAVFGQVFPRCLRYSFVMLLYSIVENEIVAVCGEVRKRRNLSELAGKETPLGRCKTFLSKTCGIDFGVSEWEKLTILEKVRDCVAHAGGRVGASRDKGFLEGIATLGKGITISEHPIFKGVLCVDQKFCLDSSDAAISLFRIIFDRAGFGSEPVRFDERG